MDGIFTPGDRPIGFGNNRQVQLELNADGNLELTGDFDITGDVTITGAMDVTGDQAFDGSIDLTGTATNQLQLPISNDAVTPTLAFGDGDSGLYESADDTLTMAIAGAAGPSFSAAGIASANANGGAILNEAASGTNPTLVPDQSDADTGVGTAGADKLSLVAGGVEAVTITETAGAVVATKAGIEIGSHDDITSASEGVAASVATETTFVTTDGDSDLNDVTLADGTEGQTKVICCVAEGNAADTWKITPANMVGGTQITFAGAGEGCILKMYSAGWVVVGNNGGTIS